MTAVRKWIRGAAARTAGRRDAGEGPLGYVVVALLCALLAVAVALSGVSGRVVSDIAAAVCRIGEMARLVPDCRSQDRDDREQARRDPDEPTTGCVPSMESHYLEETVGIPVRYVDVRTNSRGTLQLVERVGPDGRRTWEIVDFTWGEGGVGTPDGLRAGPVGGGVWGGLSITNGKVYGGFTDEREARRFFDDLRRHRIGDDIKFTLRTNPITGGFVWLGSRLPWIGDDIDEFMGGSEPDRAPTEEYLDGGLTGGFRADLDLNLGPAKLKLPFKGRGWLLSGTRVNNTNGQTTHYFTQRGEFEAAVQIDVSRLLRTLPASVRRQVQQGLDEGVDVLLDMIERQLRREYGNGFVLLPDQRAQMKAQIKLNPSVGFNYKHRGGTQWGVTYDRDGNIVGISQVQNGQDIVYVRADGKFAGQNGIGDKGQLTAGGQWILFAQRTVTQKNLDYSSAEDRAVIDRYLRDGDTDAVEQAWEKGAGTMSRLTYDNTGDTAKLEGRGSTPRRRLGFIEIGRETERHSLQSAHYYKEGQGWVPWQRCR
ncbi:hypothetical protein GCM10022416_13190 [Actinomadura keratinilytica]|uniref:Uncharacterized protein n=1 Tax=Actinomadura keratinilytica TaxID=547461 RepID=A0ABP7Y9U2_9ACTN